MYDCVPIYLKEDPQPKQPIFIQFNNSTRRLLEQYLHLVEVSFNSGKITRAKFNCKLENEIEANMGVAESRNDRFYQLCGLGKTHLVEKMLEADKQLKTININWQNYEVRGHIQLRNIFFQKFLKMFNLFLKKSKCTPLLIASANGHVKVVEILLEQNADVTLKDEVKFLFVVVFF